MEEIDLDVKLRLNEIRTWQEDIKREYPDYADKAHALMVHYLETYSPERLKIYLGVEDTPEHFTSHLDILGSLYGIQGMIAHSLYRIDKGARNQIELDWYIHRALEIDMNLDLLLDGYEEAAKVFPDHNPKAYGLFETYLKNYKLWLLKFYTGTTRPITHVDNMDAIDVMICHYWICGWLKEEEDGERTRADTNFDIRDFMKFPPNMIPSIDGSRKRPKCSFPFEVIKGGKK